MITAQIDLVAQNVVCGGPEFTLVKTYGPEDYLAIDRSCIKWKDETNY